MLNVYQKQERRFVHLPITAHGGGNKKNQEKRATAADLVSPPPNTLTDKRTSSLQKKERLKLGVICWNYFSKVSE
jgi:hypothetical protein